MAFTKQQSMRIQSMCIQEENRMVYLEENRMVYLEEKNRMVYLEKNRMMYLEENLIVCPGGGLPPVPDMDWWGTTPSPRYGTIV